MARKPRIDVGNEVYHVLNRANARMEKFFSERDYALLDFRRTGENQDFCEQRCFVWG